MLQKFKLQMLQKFKPQMLKKIQTTNVTKIQTTNDTKIQTTNVTKIHKCYRDTGRDDVMNELDGSIKDANSFYRASGDLYKHVGVLRAFEIYWNKDKPALFRHLGEPIVENSPCIIIHPHRG